MNILLLRVSLSLSPSCSCCVVCNWLTLHMESFSSCELYPTFCRYSMIICSRSVSKDAYTQLSNFGRNTSTRFDAYLVTFTPTKLYLSIYPHTHTHTHTHIYVCVYTHIHTCMYVYAFCIWIFFLLIFISHFCWPAFKNLCTLASHIFIVMLFLLHWWCLNIQTMILKKSHLLFSLCIGDKDWAKWHFFGQAPPHVVPITFLYLLW